MGCDRSPSLANKLHLWTNDKEQPIFGKKPGEITHCTQTMIGGRKPGIEMRKCTQVMSILKPLGVQNGWKKHIQATTNEHTFGMGKYILVTNIFNQVIEKEIWEIRSNDEHIFEMEKYIQVTNIFNQVIERDWEVYSSDEHTIEMEKYTQAMDILNQVRDKWSEKYVQVMNIPLKWRDIFRSRIYLTK